jgi:hypothetical protein
VTERPPGGIERRRWPRAAPDDLPEPVEVMGTRLLNISHGGLLIEAPIPLAPESNLRIRLVLGDLKTELETRVTDCRRRTSDRGRPWGVGIAFTDVPASTRRRLDAILDHPKVRSPRRRPRSA